MAGADSQSDIGSADAAALVPILSNSAKYLFLLALVIACESLRSELSMCRMKIPVLKQLQQALVADRIWSIDCGGAPQPL